MSSQKTTPDRTAILSLTRELADRFSTRAAGHDADGSFAHENFDDLRAAGYPSLTVPARFGGWGAGMLDAVLAQEQLAQGDGSTALAMAMHVQTIGAGAAGERWPPELFAVLCGEVVDRGALVNACATEPEMGSPSRGGLPATTATSDGDHWHITGHKNFASMAPALDYFIIPAALADQDQPTVARFLVPREAGVQVVETWDSMGMRSTGSHDIYLDNVTVPDRNIVARAPVSTPDPNRIALNAWFTLLVSAVYLGVAGAAHNTALSFAASRIPSGLGRPINTLENIQRRIGEGELALQAARAVLYHTAEQWDRASDRAALNPALMVAKIHVTNAAIKIVDDAMRVVGGASMTHQLPLERYYRDIRAGLFHPPFDDSALPLLGRSAIQRASQD